MCTGQPHAVARHALDDEHGHALRAWAIASGRVKPDPLCQRCFVSSSRFLSRHSFFADRTLGSGFPTDCLTASLPDCPTA